MQLPGHLASGFRAPHGSAFQRPFSHASAAIGLLISHSSRGPNEMGEVLCRRVHGVVPGPSDVSGSRIW